MTGMLGGRVGGLISAALASGSIASVRLSASRAALALGEPERAGLTGGDGDEADGSFFSIMT